VPTFNNTISQRVDNRVEKMAESRLAATSEDSGSYLSRPTSAGYREIQRYCERKICSNSLKRTTPAGIA
jgi:hypothetical protein